jgi:hypothetical protein
MKKQLLIIALLITSIAANAQHANMDFENWSQDTDSVARPDNWIINQGMGTFGIFTDEDAQNGDKAIMISRWYWYTFDDAVQTAATTTKPIELTGFYKYTNNEIQLGNDTIQDTAHVYVYAKKWNAALQQNDTIGYGHVTFTETLAWTGLVCPIYYTSNEMPDSITIRLAPTEYNLVSGNGMCAYAGNNGTCSFFSVDNLSLNTTATGINDKPAERFKLYPNPAANELFISTTGNIQTYGYIIRDVMGKTVANGNLLNQSGRVDISGLASGLYTINIFECYQMTTLKFVKQ